MSFLTPSPSKPPTIPFLPPLAWLSGQTACGDASYHNGTLTMRASRMTDWFNFPSSIAQNTSAPTLALKCNRDCDLSCRVSPRFTAHFDAAFLLVHQDNGEYAKLSFERSPDGKNKIVSCVAIVESNEVEEAVVEGEFAHLKVTRRGRVFSLWYSEDGKGWKLARRFFFTNPKARACVGFAVQSPIGLGGVATFDNLSFKIGAICSFHSSIF